MPGNLPPFVPLVFGSTIFAILGYFFSLIISTRKSWTSSLIIFLFLAAWLVFQALLSVNGFYSVTDSIPPRFLAMILPPLLLILFLFLSPRGRNWLDRIPLEGLTYLHLVRIPIELVLYWLAMYGWIPVGMTFAGWNFDILAGMTSPIAAYFLLRNSGSADLRVFVWNLLGLALLLNIVTIGILSAPGPFQILSFERPNLGIFQFPYVWLASVVVPSVLFAHIVSLRRYLLSR
ncbi:hypothetical protein ACE5IS_00560 [Leptospira wolffii]|uniref:Histidine kinase N-terminal 7TM region domain-containing protein n=1 Tax=Leptospira wolffii TaxID=409998 RepID=A0ABV5BJM5_9LEPT